MDEQHQDYLEMQKERAPAVDTATIAVVLEMAWPMSSQAWERLLLSQEDKP